MTRTRGAGRDRRASFGAGGASGLVAMAALILASALGGARTARGNFGVGWRAELYVGDRLPLDVRGVAAAAGGVEEVWVDAVKSTDGDGDFDAADEDAWTTLTLDRHGSDVLWDRAIGGIEAGGFAEARPLTVEDHLSSATLARVTGRPVAVGDVFLFRIGMNTINYGAIGRRATEGGFMDAGGTGNGEGGTVRAEMIRAVRIRGFRPRWSGAGVEPE